MKILVVSLLTLSFSVAGVAVATGQESIQYKNPSYRNRVAAPSPEFSGKPIACIADISCRDVAGERKYANHIFEFAKELTHRVIRWPKHYFEHPTTPPGGGNGHGYFETQWRPFEARFDSESMSETIQWEAINRPQPQ